MKLQEIHTLQTGRETQTYMLISCPCGYVVFHDSVEQFVICPWCNRSTPTEAIIENAERDFADELTGEIYEQYVRCKKVEKC